MKRHILEVESHMEFNIHEHGSTGQNQDPEKPWKKHRTYVIK